MKRSPLLVIFITVFIDLVGFGIVIPVLPFYAEGTKFGATPREVGGLLGDVLLRPLVVAGGFTGLVALRLFHTTDQIHVSGKVGQALADDLSH